jgi:hypothetical protein
MSDLPARAATAPVASPGAARYVAESLSAGTAPRRGSRRR